MDLKADFWVKINGYLIEVFEDPAGNLIRIDGKNCKQGISCQQAVAACTASESRAFMEPVTDRYDDSTPIQKVTQYD